MSIMRVFFKFFLFSYMSDNLEISDLKIKIREFFFFFLLT